MEVPNKSASSQVSGEETLCSFKREGQSGVRTRNLQLSKHAALTTAPAAPPLCVLIYVLCFDRHTLTPY